MQRVSVTRISLISALFVLSVCPVRSSLPHPTSFLPTIHSSILSTGSSVLHLPVCNLPSALVFLIYSPMAEQNSQLKHCSVLMHLALWCRQSQTLRGPPQSAHLRLAHHRRDQPLPGSHLRLGKTLKIQHMSPPMAHSIDIVFFYVPLPWSSIFLHSIMIMML